MNMIVMSKCSIQHLTPSIENKYVHLVTQHPAKWSLISLMEAPSVTNSSDMERRAFINKNPGVRLAKFKFIVFLRNCGFTGLTV